MHILIEYQTLAGEAVFHVAAVGMYLVFELIERAIGQTFDRFFHCERFQRFTQFVKLFGLLHSNFFAGKTPIR